MTLDWLWLFAQVAVLAGIVIQSVARSTGRNLFVILIALAMLVMVQGQAWWMFNKFQESGLNTLLHLNQVISLDGARRANVIAGLSVLSFAAAYVLVSRRIPGLRTHTKPRSTAPLLDLRLAAPLFLFSAVMVAQLAGGLPTLLSLPGQSLVHGLTMFLLLAWVGKIPFLHRVATGIRPGRPEAALFAVTFLLFLFNSRFLAVFLLLQTLVMANYCLREVPRRALVGTGLAVFAVLIVFGLYRDDASRQAASVPADEFVERRIDVVIGWFYRANVEGFAGLAGILTHENKVGFIKHDLGASELRVVFQFIPHAVRAHPALPFAKMADELATLYPYRGSVVNSGLQDAYAHFGVPGVIGLGIALGLIAHMLHAAMSDPSRDRIMIGLLSVHTLQLVRGSFFNALFFGITEVLVLRGVPLLARWIGSILAWARALSGRRRGVSARSS